ncbi:iron-sulfur-binding reductase domain protein [Mycobacterium xenopi 4042]|uniref:Iron-sulfur-binding reductase domain protein n=1 Tax=Mycobacterium xenopi 4042 TaxID=1299334 RepID=X8DKH3_MYCXE|nr:iron-sulfur-binding reductase domain protein [Mycobacterium xenopi 4042]
MMVSDGVDDRAEAAGRADVDVRDVANLLLESIDRSAVTLPARARPPSRPPRPLPRPGLTVRTGRTGRGDRRASG